MMLMREAANTRISSWAKLTLPATPMIRTMITQPMIARRMPMRLFPKTQAVRLIGATLMADTVLSIFSSTMLSEISMPARTVISRIPMLAQSILIGGVLTPNSLITAVESSGLRLNSKKVLSRRENSTVSSGSLPCVKIRASAPLPTIPMTLSRWSTLFSSAT